MIVIQDEITRLKALPRLPIRVPVSPLSGEMHFNNPLEWWRAMAPQFPWLAPLARYFFFCYVSCIPHGPLVLYKGVPCYTCDIGACRAPLLRCWQHHQRQARAPH